MLVPRLLEVGGQSASLALVCVQQSDQSEIDVNSHMNKKKQKVLFTITATKKQAQNTHKTTDIKNFTMTSC
jgi:hypothetical protein